MSSRGWNKCTTEVSQGWAQKVIENQCVASTMMVSQCLRECGNSISGHSEAAPFFSSVNNHKQSQSQFVVVVKARIQTTWISVPKEPLENDPHDVVLCVITGFK